MAPSNSEAAARPRPPHLLRPFACSYDTVDFSPDQGGDTVDFSPEQGGDTASPPPISPPPSPSKDVPGDDNNQISVRVIASGAVSDYDVAKQSALECAMADIAEVACDAVTVTITAASVILNFIIIAPPEKLASIGATITTALATTAGATTALGVTVEAVPTIDLSPEQSAPPPPAAPSGGLSVGVIAGIAIGAAAVAAVLGAVACLAGKGRGKPRVSANV